jgi:hypothetical protein
MRKGEIPLPLFPERERKLPYPSSLALSLLLPPVLTLLFFSLSLPLPPNYWPLIYFHLFIIDQSSN